MIKSIAKCFKAEKNDLHLKIEVRQLSGTAIKGRASQGSLLVDKLPVKMNWLKVVLSVIFFVIFGLILNARDKSGLAEAKKGGSKKFSISQK